MLCQIFSETLGDQRKSEMELSLNQSVSINLIKKNLCLNIFMSKQGFFSIAEKILKYRNKFIFITDFIIYPIILKFPKHPMYQLHFIPISRLFQFDFSYYLILLKKLEIEKNNFVPWIICFLKNSEELLFFWYAKPIFLIT